MPYEVHKIASYYPKLSATEFKKLRESIKRDGLLNAITLYEGKILDGTNRYRACVEEGVEPTFRELPANVDPVDYVIDQNETRRHLTREQLVLIGARLATLSRGGARKDGFQASPDSSKSVTKVAEKLKVSKTGIKRAQTVLRKGRPEVIAALESSELKVHQAEQISQLPHEEQTTVLGAMREDKALEKHSREALKAAKKKGLKVPKPVVSDLDKRWKQFLPQFKTILKLFKTFKSDDDRAVIRLRIIDVLKEVGFAVKLS